MAKVSTLFYRDRDRLIIGTFEGLDTYVKKRAHDNPVPLNLANALKLDARPASFAEPEFAVYKAYFAEFLTKFTSGMEATRHVLESELGKPDDHSEDNSRKLLHVLNR